MVVHRRDLDPADVTTVDAIPVTTPVRTIIDLASVLDRDDLEDALDEAIRRNRTTPEHIRWLLSQTPARGLHGVGTLRELLDARRRRTDVPDSPLETKVLRSFIRAGLPRPELQHEIRDGHKTIAVLDFAFPELKIGIEADGYRWHSGRRRWQRDLDRRNRLALMKWRVFHVTWDDLRFRHDEIVAMVGELVERHL
jgi:hypothetical protein